MRAPRSFLALPAAAALAVLTACPGPDVGQRCTLGGDHPIDITPATANGDYLETGNTNCDALVCIVSPIQQSSPDYNQCTGSACGYCSKNCVSNQDCFQSKTGLECRQMVLDWEFINSLDDATRQRYLADIQYSSYCAVPLP